ncbi:MAG: hypothetical protein EBX90_01815 [Betaproteobacteria bacterium]|nr:hypothetical protein [Betaproteobacteria bacterium]
MSASSRLRALGRALRAGETTSEQLTRDTLERMAQRKLNAFIDILPEKSIEQAQRADQRLAAGDPSPLLGIPLAHKDIFVTRHWRSTAGSRMLADYVSPFDAAVVERLAQAGMVYKGSVRVGGDKFDEAIVNYVRRNYGMLIGEPTAEAIKKQIGSAFPGAEMREMEVRGRNLAEGIPRTFTVSSNEILEALNDPLNQIVTSVKVALEQTPPELGADITERGIMLTGGGALVRDLDRLLVEETGLPVLIAEEPLTCVVKGCGMALERMDQLSSIFTYE